MFRGTEKKIAKVRSCSWGCSLMGLAMVSGHSRCHVTSRCSENGSLKSGPIPGDAVSWVSLWSVAIPVVMLRLVVQRKVR